MEAEAERKTSQALEPYRAESRYWATMFLVERNSDSAEIPSAQTRSAPLSPFSLSDSELSEIMNLAAGIPPIHRKAFLRSVCDALSAYPEGSRGVGLIHREAVRLQRLFATNAMRSAASGVTSKYR
jgi:hypothetical protein